MPRSSITSCGYIVRKLAKKHSVNPVWIWDLLDGHFNMRGWNCAITWEEAEELEQIMIKIIEEDTNL